jgi:hypothetical protein
LIDLPGVRPGLADSLREGFFALRFLVFSLRETAPGCAPGGAVTFLCLAKEKSPKERR